MAMGRMLGTGRVRVMLVDDHPLMRRGVSELLQRQTEYEIVGEAANGADALALAADLRPDLVISDVNLPDIDGIDLLDRLLRRQPGLRTVALTLHRDDEHLRRAVAAGVAAFASKEWRGALLLETLGRVIAGEEPIRDQLAGRVPAARVSTAELRERAAASEVGGSPLTARETEVLAAAGRGLSNKEIARELGCSDQTVKNHLTNIMRKTETGDRTQAVLLGFRRGWIVVEPVEPNMPG
jgi:DNA-binding NarL/FixJ family response regulator